MIRANYLLWSIPSLSPRVNMQLFAEIDVNDNGKLSAKEYTDNISTLAPQFSGQQKAIFDCLSNLTVCVRARVVTS